MKEKYYLIREMEVETDIEIIQRENCFYAKIYECGDYIIDYQLSIDEKGNLSILDHYGSDDEHNAIMETFCSYIKANGVKYARKCDKCGNGMNDGYCIGGGGEYYCSEECLNKVYTANQWAEMYEESEENGGNDAYWTEWDDIEDAQYVLFDSQLIEL